MYILLTEPDYAQSVWCKEILQGLQTELKKRREEYFCTNSVRALSPEDSVFVIGSGWEWLQKTLLRCAEAGITPILLGGSSHPFACHSVCSDIRGSMGQLAAGLRNIHGDRVALYGIHPDSASDSARKEAFLLSFPRKENIFHNNGSLEECLRRFLPQVSRYDAVLCANGFAAISLYKGLRQTAPESLSRLKIISCSHTLLSSYYREVISSVEMNYSQFGKIALSIADLAKKQPLLSHIHASVKWTVQALPTAALPLSHKISPTKKFYNDMLLQQMLGVENLLHACDDTDRLILKALLEEKNYADIASLCFLTEGAVKYRIRKMREICHCGNREELTTLLHTYLIP